MKFGWRGAIGIAISIACLYFAFRNVEFANALYAVTVQHD